MCSINLLVRVMQQQLKEDDWKNGLTHRRLGDNGKMFFKQFSLQKSEGVRVFLDTLSRYLQIIKSIAPYLSEHRCTNFCGHFFFFFRCH